MTSTGFAICMLLCLAAPGADGGEISDSALIPFPDSTQPVLSRLPGTFVLAILPPTCSGSGPVRPYLERLARRYSGKVPVYFLADHLPKTDRPSEIASVYGVPMVLLVSEHKVIDIHRGVIETKPHSDFMERNFLDLLHLLARNGLASQQDERSEFLIPGGRMRESRLNWSGQAVTSRDFSGADLRGMNFEKAILAGSKFTKADLRGVDFAGAFFANNDFTGANMTGANLQGAVMINVTCPDGKKVRGKGNCDGHSTRVRAGGSTSIPVPQPPR